MDGFKLFFNEMTECEKDVQETLKKIPKSHKKFIRGYAMKWEAGNTLKSDKEHIGIINPVKKTVTIAAPWRYGREFTYLHELGHQIFAELCDKTWKNKWEKIVKKHKNRDKQNNEELWCHAYANHFVKYKNMKHYHPSWDKYMAEFCKATG